MPVETEIKLRLPGGAAAARELLERRGFGEAAPRELESDQVYDVPDLALRRAGQLLRLRHRGGTWLLTYKGPVLAGRHKSREEIETTLADGEAFDVILSELGYVRTFRYEKFRTKFKPAKGLNSADETVGIVTLDETPIGSFLELEGPEYWIDATAEYLGFRAEHYITSSYATLYQEHLLANPEAPSNMTFQ